MGLGEQKMLNTAVNLFTFISIIDLNISWYFCLLNYWKNMAQGINLRKWTYDDLILDQDLTENWNDNLITLDLDKTIKRLGIQWNKKKDYIYFIRWILQLENSIINRTIVSIASKLFYQHAHLLFYYKQGMFF